MTTAVGGDHCDVSNDYCDVINDHCDVTDDHCDVIDDHSASIITLSALRSQSSSQIQPLVVRDDLQRNNSPKQLLLRPPSLYEKWRTPAEGPSALSRELVRPHHGSHTA